MTEILAAAAADAIVCVVHLALLGASAAAFAWTLRAKAPARRSGAGFSPAAWKTAIVYGRLAAGCLAAFSLVGVVRAYFELFSS